MPKDILNRGETADTPGTENRLTVKRAGIEAQVFLRGLDRNSYRLGLLDTPTTLSRRLLTNMAVFWSVGTARLVILATTGTPVDIYFALVLAVPSFLFLVALVLKADTRALELFLFFCLGLLGASL